MTNLLKSAAAIITFLFSTQISNSQETKIDNSLLWEISGNGLEKSSYLYGTLHMMCDKDFVIKEKVKIAFEKTEELALELDFDDLNELKAMQKMTVADEQLSKTLTKEEYKKLNDFLVSTIGSNAAQFENATFLSIMSTVMMKSLNCPLKVYEFEFMKMAMKKKNQILGLEKVQDQMDAFEKSFNFKDFLNQLSEYNPSYFSEMVKIYNQENINNLYEMVTDKKFMNKASQELMLDNRNANWLKLMPEMMNQKSMFFAVGAGHLPGNMGVINLLRKAGYTVKPILD
ncbi:TraB/GumN family protein [Flavobacterium sp.]|uniref:TraB/GumN family protein n=1 Tax=Flavobacterium sp. TaxID=239 RepID=UPI00286D16CD|nr:TraB/GumN family protein [Flavobacterium sp.]